jgi:hypothetical protein
MIDPIEAIDGLVVKFRNLSDAEILSAIRDMEPLPHEDDSRWDADSFWMDTVYVFDALSRVACERKLRDSISLVLERMPEGDPGEMMRGYCHGFEHIVAPDYDDLLSYYAAAARSSRVATRQWATWFLPRLRNPESRETFSALLDDPNESVRENAKRGLEILGSN